MRRHLPFGVLLASLLTACHNSPTEPTTGACATDFIATLTNTSGAATLIKYQLVLDGQLIDVLEQPAPVVSVSIARAFTPAFAGHHVLGVLIAKQTTTPSPYSVLAAQVTLKGLGGVFSCQVPLKTINLPDKTANLATGDSISYTFDL